MDHREIKIVQQNRSDDEPKLYNAVVLDNYIQLLRNNYPEVDINAVLENTGIQAWEVSDLGQWFTQTQVNNFHRQITNVCKPKTDVSIAREAGRFAGSEKSRKILRQIALSLIRPGQVYDIMGRIAEKFLRNATWKSQTISKNARKITISFKEGVDPSPHQCDNAWGALEAITLMFWDNKLPAVEHPECYFRGDKHCRYVIRWEPPPSDVIRRARNCSIAFSFLTIFGLSIFGFWVPSMVVLPLFAIIALSLSLIAERHEKKEIIQSYRGMDFKPDDYLISHSKYYNTARLVGKISRHLARHTSTDRVIVKLGQILTGLGFSRGMIFFVNPGSAGMTIELAYHYDSHRSQIDQTLEESIVRLNVIVNKMLDLSRIEQQQGHLNIEEIAINDLVDNTKTETAYIIRKYNHQIEYLVDHKTDYILCDINMMVQVITNLASNSAKYTPMGGKIVVGIERSKAGIEIYVMDNGVGIPAEEQKKVFMKFYQVEDAKNMPQAGCGLGLSFCREVVKQHGGYISIESPIEGRSLSDIRPMGLGPQRTGCKVTVHLPPKHDDETAR